MGTNPPFDLQQFVDLVLWPALGHSQSIYSMRQAYLEQCERLEFSDEHVLSRLPADRCYKLPGPVCIAGFSTDLLIEALGDLFFVFEGRIAKALAQEFELTFDQEQEVPRPSGLASELEAYVQRADGSWTLLNENDDEDLLIEQGQLYDDLYFKYQEKLAEMMLLARWLIAYESCAFPGFTLLGNKHSSSWNPEYWTEEKEQEQEARVAEQKKEQISARQAIDNAINATRFPVLKPEHSRILFEERRRQVFLTEAYAKCMTGHFTSSHEFWTANLPKVDSPEEARSLAAGYVANDLFMLFSLRYTAGESVDVLRDELTHVVRAYERYQAALAVYEGRPFVSPLALDHLGDYERVMQLIGLCYLLHRRDLLPQLALQIDSGYAGEDTLYEDLLAYALPARVDVDEYYHDKPYTPLVQAMYEEDPKEATKKLNDYLLNWYPAFEQEYWHDSHLYTDKAEGSYFGYWAFEAGAVALLRNIDDGNINHMLYPKDLVAWARENGRIYSKDSGHA